MSITEDLADKLAQDVIVAMERLGDETLIAEVSKLIGATSTTTQEAFMTAVRVRLSEKRARQFLERALAQGPVDPSKVGQLTSGRILDPTEDNPGGH